MPNILLSSAVIIGHDCRLWSYIYSLQQGDQGDHDWRFADSLTESSNYCRSPHFSDFERIACPLKGDVRDVCEVPKCPGIKLWPVFICACRGPEHPDDVGGRCRSAFHYFRDPRKWSIMGP